MSEINSTQTSLPHSGEKPKTPPVKSRGLWADAIRRLRKDKFAMLCFGVICFYAILALAGPHLITDWQQSQNYDARNLAPSLEHPFGTDALGRSVLHKTILGAHVSMTVAFWSNLIAIILGMLLGAMAGYFGRWVDNTIVALYSTLASIPGLVLLIVIKFAFQDITFFENTWFELNLGGLAGVYIALGIISWIGTCRLVRAETFKLKELDYVLASRSAGRGGISILIAHIIPNVMHIGIINFSLGFVGAIGAEVTLSYLNLGVNELPSWGKMINEARMELAMGRWWELTAAVSATFIIVLAWNIFGDRLRDALDPKLKNTR